MRFSKGKDINFLLIAPKVTTRPFPSNILDAPEHERPLIAHGFAYISSAMKKIYKNVHNLNLEFDSRNEADAIEDSIRKYAIDVVMTTGLSGQFTKIKFVVDWVKDIDPNIFVIVGGGIITASPEVAMKAFENVDIGVIGEGEHTVRDLAGYFNNEVALKDIDGIVYKENNDYIITNPRTDIIDIDSLPIPDYLGLGYDYLWNNNRYILVVASRSCPFRCTFCFHPSGKTSRARSVDGVIEEIKWLITEFPVKEISIVGEGFFAKKSRALEFCKKITKLDVPWACTMHASACEKDVLETMSQSGCFAICLGIESACDEILKSMKKQISFKKIEKALHISLTHTKDYASAVAICK